jgi:hypothetical protein
LFKQLAAGERQAGQIQDFFWCDRDQGRPGVGLPEAADQQGVFRKKG